MGTEVIGWRTVELDMLTSYSKGVRDPELTSRTHAQTIPTPKAATAVDAQIQAPIPSASCRLAVAGETTVTDSAPGTAPARNAARTPAERPRVTAAATAAMGPVGGALEGATPAVVS